MKITNVTRTKQGWHYTLEPDNLAYPTEVWVDGTATILAPGETEYLLQSRSRREPNNVNAREMNVTPLHLSAITAQWYHDSDDSPAVLVEVTNPSGRLVQRVRVATSSQGYYRHTYVARETGNHVVSITQLNAHNEPVRALTHRQTQYARPIPPEPKYKIEYNKASKTIRVTA